MNGSRDITLIRVPGWRAAHRALDELLCAGSPEDARARAVIVPTRQAAHELRRTLERARLLGTHERPAASALVLPLFVTRSEFYEELHRRLGPQAPALLSRAEREARIWAMSDAAVDAGVVPPFTVRPGLIGEMIALYDAVRRNNRTVVDFERVMTEALEPAADNDRGAARLLVQTRHLAAVFHGYEADLLAAGLDEHSLRGVLLAQASDPPLAHVVLAVADVDAEPDGLWRADFDLLLRLPGLTRIDVVTTDAILDAGFRERLAELLPGLLETRWADTAPVMQVPAILTPPEPAGRRYFTRRDREEELLALVPVVRNDAAPLDETLLVYARPLPYVYLARRLFSAHGLPLTVADTLPLAAEPFAAALDLVFEVVLSGFSSDAVLALLASPVLTWRDNGRSLATRDLQALTVRWREHAFRGGLEGLLTPDAFDASEAAGASAARARRAHAAARHAAADLHAFDAERAATAHLTALIDLLTSREVRTTSVDERYQRGRNAVLGLLHEFAAAYRRHGDRPMAFRDVAVLVRRAIEQHTFAPVVGEAGVRMLDARAARYADATVACLLGVVEGEWPRPQRGSIFYPSHLLRDLGFPKDRDRFPAVRAAFRDLVDLPRRIVAVSAFQLEEDAIVRPSVLLEDLDDWPHPTLESLPIDPGATDDASDLLGRGTPDWRRLRQDRTDPAAPAFHGQAGPFAAESLSVTKVEQYLDCPFKFYASSVLGLEEEPGRSGVGLDPRRRGTLVHAVFETFFAEWAAAGRSTITAATLPFARSLFRDVVDGALEDLPEADQPIERARLLGSPGAAGLGERVFRLEAARPGRVLERRLEHRLTGTYDFGLPGAPRLVTLRGKADRIDLLDDGTLRIIDYKTGRPPDRRRSIQLPIYAWCAEQQFAAYQGQRWRVTEAGFIAFRGEHDWVPVIARADDREALESARHRFLAAQEGMARGAFPPAPAERRLCRSCAFATVCRKDYVDRHV